ncbi:MAG TPA: site-2 protease family protein [Pyrinomonadaceae bacterium]|jgi:Zn-dependent protease|nr:site-2 protease family protein [Pyrinomonadaceae bacterium]
MGNYDIGQFILYMVAFIFSVSLHESAHAWASSHFGDDLARSQGRISLNPVSHVDPIGTLLFPGISFFTGVPLLGWARPTPVNPLKWRNKNVANFWVSIAGILVNLAIALVAGIAIRVLFETGFIALVDDPRSWTNIIRANSDDGLAQGAVSLLAGLFTVNIGLAVFNLLPIPPLDGSGVLSSILPSSFESAFEALEQFGFVLLFIAVFTGVISSIFRFVMPVVFNLVFLGKVSFS